MTLLEQSQTLLEAACRAAPQAATEVFAVESTSRTSQWSEGLPENEVAARGHGAGLRVIEDGRLGFSHTNRLDAESVAQCASRARSAAQWTAKDAYLALEESSPPTAVDLQLVDPSLESGFDERSLFLASLNAKVKKRDARFTKVLRASYSETRSTLAMSNTRGLSASYDGTSASFSIECVAVQEGETQIGYGFHAARHVSDLDIDGTVEKAMEGTLALLGGEQIPSGRYDLVLGPLIASEMLGLLAEALRGDQVLKGKSFLATRVGQPIASPLVHMIDDGSRIRGLGSSPFDADGIATRKTILVRDGVLQQYLYDAYTARKAGKRSTGNAGSRVV